MEFYINFSVDAYRYNTYLSLHFISSNYIDLSSMTAQDCPRQLYSAFSQ